MSTTDPLVPMDPEFSMPKGPKSDPGNYADKTYNPAFTSGPPVTPNRSIPKGYQVEPAMNDPYCNYDGYEGGRMGILQIDEFKVVRNVVNAVPIVYAEDCQSIDGMNGSERI